MPFVEGSVVDPAAVDAALRGGRAARPSTASSTSPGSSTPGSRCERPLHTYEQNVTGMQVLLDRMLDRGVHSLVFSSSAATFGTPDVDLVTERTPTRPESPYGESKLIGEWLIRDVARVDAAGAHLAALLQRRRVRLRRTSTTPARTTCSRWC